MPDHSEQVNAGNRPNDEGAKNQKNAHCDPFDDQTLKESTRKRFGSALSVWTAIFAALLLVILSSFAPQQIDTRVRIKTGSSISSKAHLRGESLPAHNASGLTGHSKLTSMVATGDEGAGTNSLF
ncbi:hypothetical protein [Ensifer canadensis]|uniref:hypothetical protein n=1 Tax=Ensifer canadensis TaxID=555315 RepID=UPI0035E3EBA2